MKKYCSLFVLFCVVLIIPVLCHASDWDLDADGDVDGKDLYILTGTFSSDYLEPFAAVFGSVEVNCGAFVTPEVWKEFDCYNLAAIGKITGANPFAPSWELIGGYWQWGRKGPDPNEIDWHNTNTPNFVHGPTGPSAEEAIEGSISGWDTSYAPDGAWSESYKTSNDPCPAGYRVPSESQWDGVLINNNQSIVGTTWSSSPTNYTSARKFGDNLMLQAAGGRDDDLSGALGSRGYSGGYWSSSEGSSTNAWGLYFDSGHADTYNGSRPLGLSVRCISE